MGKKTRRRYELRKPVLDGQLEALLMRTAEELGEPSDFELAREILVSAVKMAGEGTGRGELKLVNRALKELRHAFRVFQPYEQIRKVALFGSARTEETHPAWKQAYDFAESICKHGWMVITGAGDGIMGAAQGGAGRERSFGVNIRLPFEQLANETIRGDTKLIKFRYFFTRKLMFVKEAHAVVLFPGGFGTHDEGFEALTLIQTGKSEILPVVFIDQPGGSYWRDWLEYVRSHLADQHYIDPDDLNLLKVTDNVDEAAAEVLRFYSNYHSSRYVRDKLVLRVQRPPEPELMQRLNDEFASIVEGGTIEAGTPLEEEGDDAPGLARIMLRFNRRDNGKLRRMIDVINEAKAEEEAPASPHEIVEEEREGDEPYDWEDRIGDEPSSR